MSNSQASNNQNRDLNYYLDIFSSLNVSRTKKKVKLIISLFCCYQLST